MKSALKITSALTLLGLLAPVASAQFSTGSDGSYGPITTGDYTDVTLQVPPDGIFHCTTITLGYGSNLRFTKNVANTPVYLLATGDIYSRGRFYVQGLDGSPTQPGMGGPGGFDGGPPSLPGETVAGWGAGPGGGKPGSIVANAADFVGAGSYATKRTLGTANEQSNNGAVYGSALLVPLVGGSGGGGGVAGGGGGGGGGAILIASDTKVTLDWAYGEIVAHGGFGNNGGLGSGGAVRIVAPKVVFSGQPIIYAARTEDDWTKYTGSGRIRIDTLDSSGVLGQTNRCYGSLSVGKNMMIFPANLPTLEIIEAGGQAVNPAQSVTLSLPSGLPNTQPVKVRATNFGGTAKVKVVLTPERGAQLSYDLDIVNPGPGPSIGTSTVTFPGSALTRIDVWTR